MKIESIRSRHATLHDFSSTSATGPISAALSSDTPVVRRGFNEVLVHADDSVKLDEIGEHGLPLTVNHSERDFFSSDLPIGRVHNLRLEEGKLRGDMLFDTDERGLAARGKVERGVAPDISLTYRVLDFEDNGDVVNITKWQPLAASLVTVPADSTVGVGRSLDIAGVKLMKEKSIRSTSASRVAIALARMPADERWRPS